MAHPEETPGTDLAPNFAAKEYIPATGGIDSALQEVEESFSFVEVKGEMARQLRLEGNNYQSFDGLEATIPTGNKTPDDKTPMRVQVRNYEDGTESIYIFIRYEDTHLSGYLSIELYNIGTRTLKLISDKSGAVISVKPFDEEYKISYCAQKLFKAVKDYLGD